MSDFHQLTPDQLTQNPFDLIHNKWALLSAENGGKRNTMTVSWGGVGILWNKPVAFVFVRPQRYTLELMQPADRFTLSFFYDEARREQLTYCGKVSGRDEDKIAHCGFTVAHQNGAPYFEEADLVLVCKKLYLQDFSAASFLETDLLEKNYPQNDLHKMFIAEIETVLEK